jgi:crossover junction endodeoxyribonuclease RuvC
MRILGIDPGLANTGYGVIEYDGQGSKMLTSGCIITTPEQPLSQRLQQIYDELVLVIDKYRPEFASLEKLFFSVNVKSAMAVGEGRGVAILATAKANIPLAEYTPQQIKQAVTGHGGARKGQIERMVKVLLNLEQLPDTNHAADALAVAICHAHSHRYAQLVTASLKKKATSSVRSTTLDLAAARFLKRR